MLIPPHLSLVFLSLSVSRFLLVGIFLVEMTSSQITKRLVQREDAVEVFSARQAFWGKRKSGQAA